MSEICPKCGAANRQDRSTCAVCGAELEITLFHELFGPPKRLKGRYVIQRAVKQGSKLSLYHAIDIKNENQPCLVHQVALTSVAPDRRELLEYRFLQEAIAWQARRHPNIIRILDADVQIHRLYLVTEPIRGTSLRSIIHDRRQAISEPTLLHWAEQLCDALEYLHNQDPPVVLGCLSPSAIHVDPSGHVQIIEVGLIRYERSGLLTPARGIPGYAAPEQRKGPVTPRSDLYTLGIILYQLITRFDPRERPLPSLTKHETGFSEHVLQAITRTYRREPDKRLGSAAELRQELLGVSQEFHGELAPFELFEGQTVHNLPELLQACTAHWEEGLLALINRRIAAWLHQSAKELEQRGQDQAAVQIRNAAQQASEAQEEIARHALSSDSGQEIAHNAAFAAWLQSMGAPGIQPSLQVRPTKFDFGVVGATIKAKSTLHIHNKGHGYLTGRVESHMPWLSIPNAIFGCRAGETVEVPVEARGHRLQSGESRSPQAIHVISNGGSAWIEAQATSSPPLLSVQPKTLNYGPITRGASRVVHLQVANKGGGRLAGQVLSRAPWLRIRYPEFKCSAGASAQIAIELLSDKLPQGAVRIRRALAVDSDCGQAQIDVEWKWARPGLELDTAGLDMGSVERGEQITRTLTLSNSGTADLVGEALSQVNWLNVQPAEFRCPPGSSQVLNVTCDTHLLPGGSTVEEEALIIRANAGTQTLSTAVEVLAPRLIAEPVEIDLGKVRDGEQPEATLSVGNLGSLPWEGRVWSNVPWLNVEPEQISCEPGHFVPVTAMLDTQALETGGDWTVQDAIHVGDVKGGIPISVHVALARPRLAIKRHSMDFGLIGRTDIASLELEISNVGTGELEWRTAVQGTWLEIVPPSGTCGPGEKVAIQINAYALAVDGDAGQAWLTVRSNGGRIDLPASVALSSPSLAVEPLLLDLQSENYAPVTQTLRISNRGVGKLQGTIRLQVPWLRCEPQEFECATGVSTQIQVQANLEDLREGTYTAVDALRIESNAGNQEISASLALSLTPSLHLSRDALEFDEASPGSFQIENQGYGTLRVQTVSTQDWIAVNRQEWTIKAHKKARVQVTLLDPPAEGEGSIEVRTPDEVIHLPVRYKGREHITSQQSELD
jgi:serine/threonine protein kinase